MSYCKLPMTEVESSIFAVLWFIYIIKLSSFVHIVLYVLNAVNS